MQSIHNQIHTFFPDANTCDLVFRNCLQLMESTYQADLKKLLFASSVCSDDVNTHSYLSQKLNKPFIIGGLGGYPSVGKTGMVAFGHHIPDGGDAFILYGPHVGISDEGELGKMLRPGQCGLSSSCGALMLSLSRMKADKDLYPAEDEEDMQQFMLEKALLPHRTAIMQAEHEVKAITDTTYRVIEEKILTLLEKTKEELNTNRVFLLGGIIINTSPNQPGYFEMKDFKLVQLDQSPLKIISLKKDVLRQSKAVLA